MARATELFVRVSIVLLGTSGFCLGIDKHWLPDTEWQTGSNWIDNALPNAESSVVFPERIRHVVGLPNSGSVEVAKIYLPKDGELVFGTNATFMLSDSKKSEKYVTWAKKDRFFWADPDNWNGHTEATPHADRIPCVNDVVVLPEKNRVFSIAFPMVDVQVAAVRFNGEKTTLRQREWHELVNHPREFTGYRSAVKYTSADASSKCNRCACHVDNSIVEEVCNVLREKNKCGPPVCEYPFQVEGHCCAFCGGRLELSSKASALRVDVAVKEALRNFRETITWHIRYNHYGNAEILIAENGEYDGTKSEEAIDVLSKAFTGRGFEIAMIQASGSALDGRSVMTVLGPVLAIPVIVLILMLALFPYYGYSYTQVYDAWREAFRSTGEVSSTDRNPPSGGTFAFARFKNVADGDVDLTENIAAIKTERPNEDIEVPGPSSGSKRFENPLYRSTRDMDKSKTIVETRMIDLDIPQNSDDPESKTLTYKIEEFANLE